MRNNRLAGAVLFVCMLFVAINGFAAHGEKRAEKKAILLAAFGTTVPEAQKALDQVEAQTKKAFPGVEVRWAYTSTIVRKRLSANGKVFDSPETALAKLMDDGFTHVSVLSLHTIPGQEFHELLQNVHLFGRMAGGFEKALVAWPLLASHEDMERVAKAMIKQVPAGRRTQDAVLLMGHGNEHHPADAAYAAMNQVLREIDENVYVGTVEGYPSLDDILPKLAKKKVKKVYLMPFMAVAGDHARNDMAGNEPDSWKSILEKEGYTCEVVIKGMGEYPEVVDVWLDHLRAVIAHSE